jgi:hypothetical protein
MASPQYYRAQLMEAELVGGHNPEVVAAAADDPEKVFVLLAARRDESAIGSYHVDRGQVVAGQTLLRREPAVAASQREAANTSRRNSSPGVASPKI